MAKITFNSITPIKKIEPKVFNWCDQDIEVIQYLPVSEKLALVERVLNATIDSAEFLNPVRLEIYTYIEIVKTYTNISITDKMMENPQKVYDALIMNDVISFVINSIPENEFNAIFDAVNESAEHVVKYLNSFVGMLKTISNDYDSTKLNVDGIMNELNDPEAMTLLKDILDKIG